MRNEIHHAARLERIAFSILFAIGIVVLGGIVGFVYTSYWMKNYLIEKELSSAKERLERAVQAAAPLNEEIKELNTLIESGCRSYQSHFPSWKSQDSLSINQDRVAPGIILNFGKYPTIVEILNALTQSLKARTRGSYYHIFLELPPHCNGIDFYGYFDGPRLAQDLAEFSKRQSALNPTRLNEAISRREMLSEAVAPFDREATKNGKLARDLRKEIDRHRASHSAVTPTQSGIAAVAAAILITLILLYQHCRKLALLYRIQADLILKSTS